MISTFALFLCLENKRVKDTKERRRILLTITDYVKAKTLEEAYELNQARNSRVMGGMMWMRLGNARVKTVIDLSELGLDQIEETDHVFKIRRNCCIPIRISVLSVQIMKKVRDSDCCSVRTLLLRTEVSSGSLRRKEKVLRSVSRFRCWKANISSI